MRLSNTLMISASVLPSKKAFTLAEVLITLSILGVIAAITIPALVNRNNDIAAQTKIKKAIAAYENVANVYMAENQVADLAGLVCADMGDYFKIVSGADTCQFTTADGVEWTFDTNGNVGVITDAANSPRYAVTVWTNNGLVNGGTFDAAPTAPEPSGTPAVGYYQAPDFLTKTPQDLSSGTDAADAAEYPVATP